ncbi:MAG TPA: hypothetical protein VN814_12840, partial [Caulobacteraceae bacterium]|nr:hypothetical protein [Caulobacteraceae bacterium]
MMKMRVLRVVASLMSSAVLLGAGAAMATTINFSAMPAGAVTAPIDGVTFSLSGGLDSSGPADVGYGFFDSRTSLNNSTNSTTFPSTSGYPTATILDAAFSSPEKWIRFTFSNYGSGNGSFYSAFGPGNTLISSGSLSNVNGYSSTIYVPGAGITDLQFNNNSGGNGNWIFGVGELTF